MSDRMQTWTTKTLAAAAVFGAGLGMSTAQAAIIPLTLENPGSTQYQQTQNSPCIIGDNSCKNPGGFVQTDIPNNTANYTLSATFTVAQIVAIVGTSFFVGIDVNTTTQPVATEQLASFTMTVGGDTYSYVGGPTPLITQSNGNGYSDALLKDFSLSGYASGLAVTFTASIVNATDGKEQFFLISSSATPVPEPASLGLLGLGLLGLAGLRQLRQRAA